MLKVIRNSARETLPRLTGRGHSHRKDGNKCETLPAETLDTLREEWQRVERLDEAARRRIFILLNKCHEEALRQLQSGRIRHLSLAAKMELDKRGGNESRFTQ